MGLLSLFHRKTSVGESAAVVAPQAGDAVQRARTRARQRLIGAAVLVGIGIVGFPLLFETHPRPIPVDIPIEIVNKDKVAPLALPPPRPGAASAAAPVMERRAPATSSDSAVAESASEAAASAAVAATKAPSAEAPARKPEAPQGTIPAAAAAKAPAAPAAAEGARARATLDGKAGAGKDASSPSADARFVVQVGAFAEAAAARETRLRVEKLGLKTYTQVVETAAGNRIRVRVGPFASRDEADRVAGKLKSAGLPAALLTL